MTEQRDPITQVVAFNLCTGCGACAGRHPDLIRMVDDPVNGRRPVVTPGPAGDAASAEAMAVCAGAGADHASLPIRDQLEEDWGPVLATWEGWASDNEIRHRGSSGGAGSALAVWMVENGEADGALHIAQRAEDPRLNEGVISRDRAGLLNGAGSRYAQASPLERLADIKSGTERVAVIGKPCDIASAAKACAADPDLAAKIPATIAIFCAGAPNLVATDKLLDRLGVPKDGKLTDLRYRGSGWPGLMQARWTDTDGAEHESEGITYAEGWGRILQAERRWRCRICADHTGEFADISVGDPWHDPPEGNLDEGRSLIVARTERGVRLVEAAIAAGAIIATASTREIIAAAQPNLLDTRGAVWGRRWAMRLTLMRLPKDKGLHMFRLWRTRLSFKAKLQSVGGALKRILRAKLWKPVRIKPMEPRK
jgi:coenzyme F420 hydrogenase subunit beta